MSEIDLPRSGAGHDTVKPFAKREVFPVLDGVRVVMTFWVVCFHTLWHTAMFTDSTSFKQIMAMPYLELLANGLNAVDVFFVLTGFLLAHPIFVGQRTGKWWDFVWLRLTRVYPLLITTVFMVCGVIYRFGTKDILDWSKHPSTGTQELLASYGVVTTGVPNNCQTSWTNLLFINNLVPFGGCMGWTWSLCIQVHFYLIFPLVIRYFGTKKTFIRVSIAMAGVWAVSRLLTFIYIVKPYGLPKLYLHNAEDADMFFIYFNVWYSSTYQRIGCCFCGVMLAWLYVNRPQWLQKCEQSSLAIAAFFLFTLVGLYYSVAADYSSTFEAFFWTVGGFGHLISISITLYMLLRRIGPYKYLVPFLSSNLMKQLAYPTYPVYLIHSAMIIEWFDSGLLPDVLPFTYSKYAIWCFCVLLSVYVYGYLVTRFIEEPIKGYLRNMLAKRRAATCEQSTTNNNLKVQMTPILSWSDSTDNATDSEVKPRRKAPATASS